MSELKNKVLFITGAARRVGAVVCRRLHAEGMNIVLHYRNSVDDAQALQRELESARARSVALVQGDLNNMSAVVRMAADALEAFGRIDVLYNNASSFYPTPVGCATEAQWDDLFGSNLKAPFFLSQALAAALTDARGCIINTVDIYGAQPLKSYPIYSAAKAGLVMLTKSLARELAPAVRVNGIAPGTILWPEHGLSDEIKTKIVDRTPQKRAGGPDDIAKTALFLIRDAGYITGQIIAVDGGRSIVL